MIRPFARCWNSQCKWASGSKRGMGSRQLTGRPWDNQGGAVVSGKPKTQIDAMKTQFQRNAGVKCLTDKGFSSRQKPNSTELKPNCNPMPLRRAIVRFGWLLRGFAVW